MIGKKRVLTMSMVTLVDCYAIVYPVVGTNVNIDGMTMYFLFCLRAAFWSQVWYTYTTSLYTMVFGVHKVS